MELFLINFNPLLLNSRNIPKSRTKNIEDVINASNAIIQIRYDFLLFFRVLLSAVKGNIRTRGDR